MLKAEPASEVGVPFKIPFLVKVKPAGRIDLVINLVVQYLDFIFDKIFQQLAQPLFRN